MGRLLSTGTGLHALCVSEFRKKCVFFHYKTIKLDHCETNFQYPSLHRVETWTGARFMCWLSASHGINWLERRIPLQSKHTQALSPFHCSGTIPSRRSTTGLGMMRPVLTDTRTLSPSSVYFHSTSVGFLEDHNQHVTISLRRNQRFVSIFSN